MWIRRGLSRVLLLLLLVAADAADVQRSGLCDRPRTRFARNKLEQNVLLLARQRGVDLPSTCPWHRDRDRLLLDDNSRTVNGVYNRFTCALCKKAFRTEYHLDMHFDNRHNNSALGGPDVCLADYCDILRCAPVSDRDGNEHPIEQQYKLNDQLCTAKGGPEQRRAFCQMVVHSCFPTDQGSAVAQLNEHLIKTMCDTLTCKTEYRPPTWAESRLGSVLWLVLAIMLAVVILLYYVIIYLNKREFKTNDDLVRRRSRRPDGTAAGQGSTLQILTQGMDAVKRRVQKPASFN